MRFVRTAEVSQLYVPDEAPGQPLLILPRGHQPAAADLSVAQSWQSGGSYLFLPAPVPGPQRAAFAEAVWRFLDGRGPGRVRFAWLSAGSSGPGPAVLSGPALAVADTPSPVTAGNTDFSLRNIGLSIPVGAPVSLVEATSVVSFGGGNAAASVTAQRGQLPAGTVASPVDVSLTGTLRGCLRFRLRLTPADLDALAIGLKYFWADPGDPRRPGPADRDFPLASYRYRLFAAGLTVYAVLDPLAVLDGSRTYLAFSAPDAQLTGEAAAAVATYLRSQFNTSFSVTPLSGAGIPTGPAKLVFAIDQQASSPTPGDPLYLTPAGDFALTADQPAGGSGMLMGGLSGVEYFDLRSGGTLSFFPGEPAFAAGFIAGKPDVASTLIPRSTPTTSYASLSLRDGSIDYYAQPDESALHNFGAGQMVTDWGFAIRVQAGTLRGSPDASSAFPLLPYAGASGADLAVLAQLEAQVISPARHGRLRASQPRPPAGNAPPAVEEQAMSVSARGLLASYAGGASERWSRIVLTQTGERRLSLTNVDGDLLAAFHSSKLFLVITDPGSVAPYLRADDAVITAGSDPGESWRFSLDPAGWHDAHTVLIIKYHDLSIEQLAASPGRWASPATFNRDPDAARVQIESAVQRARDARAKGDESYRAFLAAVTDPAWNGVLALSVPAPLDQLPADLRGLATGIDGARFRAHHVGVAASKIALPGTGGRTTVGITDSSVFGLIDYHAPAPLPVHSGDWAFQVGRLSIVLEDRAVTSFSSVIDLQVNTLFGEAATLRGPGARGAGGPGQAGDNVLQLFGVYGKQEAGGQARRGYVFRTGSGQSAVFDLNSRVLTAVVISGAEFVTRIGSATDVASQFLLRGLLEFAVPPPADKKALAFDAFSFGGRADGAPAGLAFGNLILRVTGNPAAPADPPRFAFDASSVTFDLSRSTVRPDSLYQHLPLTLARMTQGNEGAAPTDLGFMGVQTPLTLSALSGPWFALEFDLNLGTAGALAATAGFVATLAVAWSPAAEGEGYRVFTGLKLPGSSGAKRSIPIEGILALGFKSLQIAQPEKNAFVLMLYGIGLEFLGFTFPPSGQVNLVLFGDPHATGGSDTSLGWYAVYAKPPGQPEHQGGPPRIGGHLAHPAATSGEVT